MSKNKSIPVEGCNCGICQNARFNAIIIQVAKDFFELGIQEAIREDTPVPFKSYWNEYIAEKV